MLGCAFVLVVDASGSGKSSLARAGVLPALNTGGFDESVSFWGTAVLSPSSYENDLCKGHGAA